MCRRFRVVLGLFLTQNTGSNLCWSLYFHLVSYYLRGTQFMQTLPAITYLHTLCEFIRGTAVLIPTPAIL